MKQTIARTEEKLMKYPALKSMITGVAVITLVMISQVFALPDTNKEVLSQKILLENTVHQRVSDAVYRILRHENFIVNVNVVMEATPSQQYTTIYERPEAKGKTTPEQAVLKQSLQAKSTNASSGTGSSALVVPELKTRTVLKKRPIQTNVPSDIPGFPGIQSPGFELYEEEVPYEEDNTNDVIYAAEDDLSRMANLADTNSVIQTPAAEASLALDENEVILEETIQPESEKKQDQTIVGYTDVESPRMSRHTVASTTGPSLRVRKMELTVILEDPVSPQIVENIRTVAMVASHFNRERGDKLQVMTADFQGAKSKSPDTEQLLLKSIAEKMTAIESRQKAETENQRIKELENQQERMRLEQAAKDAQQAELAKLRQQEIDKQKEHEAELARIRQAEEDRIRQREAELDALRQQEEARLAEERRQLFEAQQEQARDRLRQDSLRLALLTEQLSDLKNQLSSVDLEEEQRLKLELEQKRREAERSAIRDREEDLKRQLSEIENQRLQASMLPEEDDKALPILILGAGVLLLLAILVGALMGSRSRRADRLPEHTDTEDKPEAEEAPEPPPAKETPDVVEKPEVDQELMSEVDSIKKSVVSLAVSKPGSASSIVKEWLKDAGAEEGAEEEEPAEEKNGKNKKKGSK
jgi:hypothetical protein